MEFPDLGQNCAKLSCKQLDFLPMKCDACSQIFCKNHIQYICHECPESYRKDNQVPVCPLCDKPIPVRPGETADSKVDAHISTDCQSDPAKQRRKVYTNRCSKKGCKVKEIVSVMCDRCSKNFCLKHRHENDHDCTSSRSNSPAASTSNLATQAAIERSQKKNQTPSTIRSSTPQQTLLNGIGSDLARQRESRGGAPVGGFQAGLSEQEALERALQLSLSSANAGSTTQSAASRSQVQQEVDDLALARAIAESEKEAANTRHRTAAPSSREDKSSCAIS